MNKEYILEHLPALTPEEIADAIRNEVVSYDEIKDKLDPFTLLLLRRILFPTNTEEGDLCFYDEIVVERKSFRAKAHDTEEYGFSGNESRISCDLGILPLPENEARIHFAPSSRGFLGGNFKHRLFKRKKSKSDKTVYSALYAPGYVCPDTWFRVQVHLYDKDEAVESMKKAQALDSDSRLMDYNPLSMQLRLGTRVKTELSFFDAGVEVKTSSESLTWYGELISSSFFARVIDPSLRRISGEVLLSVDEIPIGKLSFAIDVDSLPIEVYETPLGNTHSFKKVFISYSHHDIKTAEVFASAYRAQGLQYFLDSHSLDSGSIFNDVIKKSIEESDLFILLWSQNAAQSESVEKEYLYAMQFAYPQRTQAEASLLFKPFFIDPYADPPISLKNIYHFSRINSDC